eukprot:Clim_evm35s232 gene=Clim_evmTU35s232
MNKDLQKKLMHLKVQQSDGEGELSADGASGERLSIPSYLQKFENSQGHGVWTSQGATDASENDVATDPDLTPAPTPRLKSTARNRAIKWLQGLAVVDFDKDFGQKVEYIFPDDCLTIVQKQRIAFLSFPESNTSLMGDTTYFFRLSMDGAIADISDRSTSLRQSATETGSAPELNPVLDGESPKPRTSRREFIHGCCLFRQEKDDNTVRGYMQKSVVALSMKPIYGLLRKAVEILAPAYFVTGETALETAYHEISSWPTPVDDSYLTLHLLGEVMEVHMPDSLELPHCPETARIDRHTNATRRADLIDIGEDDINIFTALKPVLPHLWQLFELMMLGEPILVFARSPATCSRAVIALTEIIRPMRFRGDYRPYFTVHDPDFHAFANAKMTVPKETVLGVNNPGFVQSFAHWPHIVFLDDMTHKSKAQSPGRIQMPGFLGQQNRKVFLSDHKSYLTPDKQLLAKLSGAPEGLQGQIANDNIIRNHFINLTSKFLIPVESHLVGLMPLKKHIVPWKSCPELKKLDRSAMLRNMDGTTIDIKGDWKTFYARFLAGQPFVRWYKRRRRQYKEFLREAHQRSILEPEIIEWAKEKHELEIVDLLLKVRQMRPYFYEVEDREKLEEQSNALIAMLPEDLKASLDEHVEDAANNFPPYIRRKISDLQSASGSAENVNSTEGVQ